MRNFALSPSARLDSIQVFRIQTPSGTPSDMSRTCLALAAFAALIASVAAANAAGPVTRQCDYRGEGKLGPLVVAYDASAHLVRVTSADGRLWLYQDGAIGRLGPAIAALTIQDRSSNSSSSGRARWRLVSAGQTTARPAIWPTLTRRRSRIRRSAASGARFGTSRWAEAGRVDHECSSHSLERPDMSSKASPLLTGACYSLQAVKPSGGFYFRHQIFLIVLPKFENSDQFPNDATFCIRSPGLTGVVREQSLSSLINFPQFFIRYSDFQLFLNQSYSSCQFSSDATFRSMTNLIQNNPIQSIDPKPNSVPAQ